MKTSILVIYYSLKLNVCLHVTRIDYVTNKQQKFCLKEYTKDKTET